VAYPYRDNYPSKKIDVPNNSNQECCRQHVALNAVGDIDKGSLAERDERESNYGAVHCHTQWRKGYTPRIQARTHGILAHFMVRLYIAVVCK